MGHQFADFTILQWFIPVIISLWGGAAGYLSQILAHHRKFSWIDFFSRAFISSFVGMDVFLLTDSMEMGDLVRASLVGLAAWLGAETMTIIRNLHRIKILVDDEKT